jgi:ATP-dependent RNA helicase DeaD
MYYLCLSVIEKLLENGIIAAPLFGGNEKTDRSDVCKALREGNVGCVVATEMAARGIDAPFLTHVINVDLPTDASHYAHRAGRAGRGGRPGIVINFTCSIKERKVPYKFAECLGVPMHTIAPRAGKLIIIDDATDVANHS